MSDLRIAAFAGNLRLGSYNRGLIRAAVELLISSAASLFDADGDLVDADTREAIAQLLFALRTWSLRLAKPAAA